MRIVYFTHSLSSCWNHGNAHFLRGVLRELRRRGHEVVAFEPPAPGAWPTCCADHGEAGLGRLSRRLSRTRLDIEFDDDLDLDGTLSTDATSSSCTNGTSPRWSPRSAHLRRRGARFTLLFHDTHHRAVSDPEAIRLRSRRL